MTQHDQQLPDRNGDVIDDIAAALSKRGDLSDEHRAFYRSVLDRFEGLTSERDRLATDLETTRVRLAAYEQAAAERPVQCFYIDPYENED
jgi:hypothetical protein